jgi:hypothetical protein
MPNLTPREQLSGTSGGRSSLNSCEEDGRTADGRGCNEYPSLGIYLCVPGRRSKTGETGRPVRHNPAAAEVCFA